MEKDELIKKLMTLLESLYQAGELKADAKFIEEFKELTLQQVNLISSNVPVSGSLPIIYAKCKCGASLISPKENNILFVNYSGAFHIKTEYYKCKQCNTEYNYLGNYR